MPEIETRMRVLNFVNTVLKAGTITVYSLNQNLSLINIKISKSDCKSVEMFSGSWGAFCSKRDSSQKLVVKDSSPHWLP